MKNKVLQIITKYIEFGGEEAVANYDKIILEKNGYQVDQIIFNNTYLKKNILYTFYVLLNLNRNYFTKRRLKKYIKINRPIIVHIHSYFPQFPLSLVSFLKSFNVKIFFTIHNYRLICSNGYFFKNNEICFDCLNKKFNSAIQKKCYKNSRILTFLTVNQIKNLWSKKIMNQNIDLFFCNHDFIKNIHIQYGIDSSKIIIRSNPISNIFGNIPYNDIDKKKEFALFVGRDSSEKGLSTLLDVWNDINYQLVLLGNFKKQEELSQNNNLLFMGFCNDQKKHTIYQQASFLLFTSKWHEAGTPLVILEALASGTPIICSNIDPMNKIITHKVNGLIYNNNDPSDLKEKINLLINNHKLRNELSLNALLLFQSKYSQERSASILLNTYASYMN